MRDISKRFPGVLALDNVSLSIERGEVHALLGENGAGKSTLMKILSGAYKKDAGEIIFDGQPVQINSPRQAQELGVSIIYQELNLVPQLSVAENIFLSSLPMKNPACIDWKRVYSDAQTIIDSLEVDINVRSRISSLGIAQQQMVEIAKALNHQAKVIVMDEPSAPLTDKETAKLFKTIAKLKSEGVAVIYISHRLEETMQIADRATIMRDGKTITTVNVSDITIDDLIRGMVGHDLKEQFPKRDCPIGEVGFHVEGISREGILNNISFEARKGEVVGICGLVGAGRTETARAIFGIDPKDAGRVFIDGKEAVIRKPLDAINAGIGFVTEDRKTEGLILCRDCKENISIAALRDFVRSGKLNLRREQKSCQDYVEKMHIKTPSLRQKVVNLSGGNQQKIVLAKWLMSDAKVLFLDEPTRGIDIGAKVEVYNIINEIAAAGKCVIVISAEMTELMGICDRIVVMCRGTITGEERKGQFTQESLMYLATGGSAAV